MEIDYGKTIFNIIFTNILRMVVNILSAERFTEGSYFTFKAFEVAPLVMKNLETYC